MSHEQPPPTTEYLTDEPPPEPRRRGRWWIVAAAAVGVAVVGGGAYGVAQFMSAGPSPATAVPGNALAYVGLDLDPSGGQKVEAAKTLRKFPAIKDRLGLTSGDDLRGSVLETLIKEGDCEGLDYGEDIEPWIGNKVGLGAVPGDDEPTPFGVVQVTDEDKARAGVDTLDGCGGSDSNTGVAFTGDYMVLAESDDVAKGIVADVEEGSLADDDAYQKWVDEAGGDGILTAYVAPDGAKAALDSLGGSELPTAPEGEDVEKAFADFQGGALVARFDDEALKVEVAAGGLPAQVKTGGDSGLTELPTTTAAALGVGVSDTFAEDLLSNLRDAMGSDVVDQLLQQAEAETGLSLPEDLQALLGDGVSVALDSSLDFGAFFGGTSGGQPSDFPMGVRISGDPAEIMPALEKVLEATGAGAQGVVVETRDGAVAVGVSRDYVAKLAGNGGLGDQQRFDAALPDLPEDAGGLYVDFDAGDWLTSMVESAPDSDELRANLEPLSSLGITGGVDGDTVHGVLRLSTD